MSEIIVTGGAGFIGSALVWGLNQRGEEDILIVDSLDHDEKEHNVAPLKYDTVISGDEFRRRLKEGDFDNEGIAGILHMGAISSTIVKDWNTYQDANVDFSQEVIRWCVDRNVRCVYASSAATYGKGGKGYSDDHALFDELEPMNLYGKSKLMVDIWARDGGYLDKVAGLRYFNVFGPNEWHKGEMSSVIAKRFADVRDGKPIRLFKSYHPDYADGESARDFVYVKDVVDATLFFWESPEANGVCNVGSGIARSWNDVARALFSALNQETQIEYFDMPGPIRNQYQYFTQSDVSKLREAGYKTRMRSLENATNDYVRNYLVPHLHLGEDRS